MKRATILCAVVLFLGFSAAPALAQGGGALTADDYIEIQQLYAKYAHTIDLGDAEGWADTFTPDGMFGDPSSDSATRGRQSLVAFAANAYVRNSGTGRHWNSQVLITPTSAGADGSCYLLLLDTGAQPVGIRVAGIYRDKIVKTADGWRFSNRVASADRPSGSN